MPTPILATKLHIPRPRPNAIPRARLLARLRAGRQGKLTLVSAPAGFGKTTLVSAWIAADAPPTAWLSLDEGDNEPTRFLTYLVAALQTLAPDLGQDVMDLLHGSQPPVLEELLTVLLNAIAAFPDDFVLVLDDYHVLDAPPLDQALTFLLDHLPPQMHLVITTREDPLLPLARLRVRGQLTEIRTNDLRFTAAEAVEFFHAVMGVALSAEEVAALDTRTEGWVAGLQLAALSLQGRTDTAEFIQAFAGDHRYVVDYLVAEVLQGQPDPIRTFLLQTSLLSRLRGALCNAVTQRSDGDELLDALERANLFLVPLDDQRQWYRYHHLFADVLYAHLRAEQPDQVSILHRRASEWHAQNGLRAEAIRHALAAQDHAYAAELIELAWPEMDGTFQSAAWLKWVRTLPDALIRARPVLGVAYGWALLNQGEIKAGEARLRDAEHLLEAQPPGDASPPTPDMVVADREQFRRLPASIATARAYAAQSRGDRPNTLRFGRRALDLLPSTDHLQRGVVGALLGLAYWANGELDTAHDTLAQGMRDMQLGGNPLFALRGTYGLADMRLAQGRLRDAIDIYTAALHQAEGHDALVRRGTADLHLGLSALYLECNQWDAALDQLHHAEKVGEHDNSPHWRYRLCLAQARIAQAQGDLAHALELLDEAAQRFVPTPVPDVTPIAAQRARIYIAQGNLGAARAWVDAHGLSIDDELDYLREFEHITLARLLIAEFQRTPDPATNDAATRLLARLLAAAEAGVRQGSALEILLLQALAHQTQGQRAQALAALERALIAAAPEGYVRLFVREGPRMAELLTQAAAQGIESDYIDKLLAVFATDEPATQGTPSAQAAPSPVPSPPAMSTNLPSQSAPAPQAQPDALIEPLSERELEVLQLIAQGLSNREIGERLFVALSTVKGHNRNIFDKLQVQRRTEAVARARELGLV